MTAKPAYRMGAHDRTAVLKDAKRTIERSGVLDILGPTKPKRTGRKATLGQYTALGLLCTMYEIAHVDGHLALTNIAYRLWFVYTDAQLALLGMAEFRDPARRDFMLATLAVPDGELTGSEELDRALDDADGAEADAVAQARTVSFTDDQYRAAHKMWLAEYQRLVQFAQKVFEPVDNSPLPGRAPNGKSRYTRLQLKEAREEPRLIPITELQQHVINAIIAGGLNQANDALNPGTTLHTGLLRDHKGDIAIDEKHVTVGLAASRDSLATAPATGSQLGDYDGHNRRFKRAFSIGLTLGITAYPPYGNKGPHVALGMDVHKPTAGDVDATNTVLDAVETHGLKAPLPKNMRPRLITDKGYSNRNRIHREVLQRKYDFLMTYTKKRRTAFKLRHPDGTPSGITQYQGVPLCPGAGRDLTQHPFTPANSEKWTRPLLQRHQKTEALYLALTMRRNGAPVIGSGRPVGGQNKDAPAPKPVVQMDVRCPAREGKIRCPLVAGSMTHNDMADKPLVPKPPTGDLPRCCETGKLVTVNIDDDAFKQTQRDMVGTWAHADYYSSGRAFNEGFNGRLVDPHGGGNLWHSGIMFRRNGHVAVALAIIVAVTNRKVIEAWTETLRNNGGKPPVNSGNANRNKRAAILNPIADDNMDDIAA